MVHIYRHEGIYFPSVTTIIGATVPVPERLANWKLTSGTAGIKKMKDSQITGTLAHYRILNKLAPNLLDPPNFDYEKLPKGTDKKLDMCELMFDTLDFDIGHPRRIEKLLYSKKHIYAGTPDLVAPINGVYTLADLKTSKEIYESHRLQLGGYYELLGCTPEQGLLISINPDPYTNPHMRAVTCYLTKDDLESYREQFLVLCEKFHTMDLTPELIKQHGLSFEE